MEERKLKPFTYLTYRSLVNSQDKRTKLMAVPVEEIVSMMQASVSESEQQQVVNGEVKVKGNLSIMNTSNEVRNADHVDMEMESASSDEQSEEEEEEEEESETELKSSNAGRHNSKDDDDDPRRDPDYLPNKKRKIKITKKKLELRSSSKTSPLVKDRTEAEETHGDKVKRRHQDQVIVKKSIPNPTPELNIESHTNPLPLPLPHLLPLQLQVTGSRSNDNVTSGIPASASSSAQVLDDTFQDHQHVEKPRAEVTIAKRPKRKSTVPARLSTGNYIFPMKRKYQDEDGEGQGQSGVIMAPPTVNTEHHQWLSNIAGALEMIEVYELFFNRAAFGQNLEDACLLFKDASFHERRTSGKLSKIIAEGEALVITLQNQGSNDILQEIQSGLEDLKNKTEKLKSMANMRIYKLRCSYYAQQIKSELVELENFIEKSLQFSPIAEGEDEDREKNCEFLEKEIEWREGRIEDIKERATQHKLECLVRTIIKNAEDSWARLMIKVENDKKFCQFEKACKGICGWFRRAKDFADDDKKLGYSAEETQLIIRQLKMLIVEAVRKQTGVNELSKGLIAEGHPDSEKIQQRAAEVTALKDELQRITDKRLERLRNIQKMDMFIEHADKLFQSIEAQKMVVSRFVEDPDETLDSLIEKHSQLGESYRQRFEAEITKTNMEAQSVEALFPENKGHIKTKVQAYDDSWKELQELLNERRDKLLQTQRVEPFLNDYSKMKRAVEMSIKRVNEIPVLCMDVGKAKQYLEKCKRCLECFKNNRMVDNFNEKGMQLLNEIQLESLKKKIQDKMDRLKKMYEVVVATGEDKLKILNRNLNLNLARKDIEKGERERVKKLKTAAVILDYDSQ